jgi:hypothetical protein
MIEIYRKSPKEARQGPVPDKHEYDQARWEEGPDSAISGRVNQGQGGCHKRGVTAEDDQAKKSEGWPMVKNEGSKPQRRPKATFDIIIAKYKEGKADIRGHKSRTIWNTKPDNLISLSQASISTARSTSDKRSGTPPHQNSEARDRRQQDYDPVPYFPIGLPMLRLWGPLSMMYPPCPPWAGWYGPWAPLPMHFHPGWSRLTEGFDHGGYYAGDDRYEYVATSRTGGPQGRKTGQSRMPNQTI